MIRNTQVEQQLLNITTSLIGTDMLRKILAIAKDRQPINANDPNYAIYRDIGESIISQVSMTA